MKIISDFDKNLSLYIIITIIIGTLCGHYIPKFFEIIDYIQFQNINLVISIFTWILIYPMMLELNFVGIKEIFKHKRGFGLIIFLNWIVTPLITVLISTIFFEHIYSNFFSSKILSKYMIGFILISLTPCSATIIIWNKIIKSNINFTVTQIILNNFLILFLYAPTVKFILKTVHIEVPIFLLFMFTLIYLIIPFIFSIITKEYFNDKIENINIIFKYLSPIALLSIIFLSFGFQANIIIKNPLIIILISIPMLIQTYLMFFIGYFIGYKIKLPYEISAPVALISASNFFEFSIAISISLFGLHSLSTMATAVGTITEVPVMLSLIKICKKTKNNFDNKISIEKS